MRGTDVQYNQQLGLLGAVYTIEGNNAVPRGKKTGTGINIYQ